MDAPSQEELDPLNRAAEQPSDADMVVHWQSVFGLVVIETRGGRVYVNGQIVEPAGQLRPQEC